MEDDKKSSMSDKDRKMAGRFEGFGHKKEDDEEKKGKKTSKIPKKSLFLGSEARDTKAELAPKTDEGTAEKKNLFSGLFKDKEIAVVDTEPESEVVKAEFSEVIVDRLQEVEKELELPDSGNNAVEIEADAEFLEHVGERLNEGMEPELAIEDALEDVYQPPEVDARPMDLGTPEHFDAIPAEKEDDEPIIAPTQRPTIPQTPPPSVYNPNIAPNQPPAPNVVSSPNIVPMNDTFYRDRNTGDLLLGGTLGYIMGKNRGRNVAEGRLEPEIKKLDKKVDGLKQKLEDSERQVRAEVSKNEQLEIKPKPLENTVEKPMTVNKVEQDIEIISPNTLKAEQKIVESQERQFEDQLQEMADLEIASLKAPKVETGPVSIGEVLESKSKNPETEAPEVHRDVRSMTMTELLEVAEHISLEKTSLRELYERNRIDGVNLRRVIIEYMNGGGRYEQMLRGSLEAVEMQRELRGEIKRESDFSGSGIVSSSEEQNSSPESANAEVANQKHKLSHQSISQTNLGTKIAEENDGVLFTNTTAVILGVTVGIIITIVIVLFANS